MTILCPIQLTLPEKPATEGTAWSKEEFERQLRAKGKFYHVHHEYNVLLNTGKLEKKAIQGWVANRFYYQAAIPMKDAAVMANCSDRNMRRHWIQRNIDHDGSQSDEGGIEAWIQLGLAVGLTREEICSFEHVLPGVRFAVDSYVNFARRVNWQEAVCSSLTELFAPSIHKIRLDGWPAYYPWIDASGYAYFRKRLHEAPRDVEHGLRITLESFTTRPEQEHALNILQFKLDILWSMLDSMWMAYIVNKPPYWNIKD